MRLLHPTALSTLLVILALTSAQSALAANPPKSKAIISLPADSVWSIKGSDGKSVSCARYKNRNIIVRAQSKKFVDVKSRLSELAKVLGAAGKYSGAAVKSAKKEQTDLKAIQKRGANCSLGKPATTVPPTPPPAATPTPTPVPAEFSMAPYTGPVEFETMRYLLEKVAYGVSSNEQPVIDLGLAQNLPGAIDELLRVKPEDSTLENRITDRLNATNNVGGGSGLGDLATQNRDSFSFRGMRAAVLDRAINTTNPARENLAQFLLGLWTVGHDVLTNNPAGNPQRVLWWNYFNLLRDLAYDRPLPEDIRQEMAGKPKFPAWLVRLQRDPMMLLWLSGNQNVKGNPNENYARELMELFTLGTQRVDDVSSQAVPNYVEFRNEGNRTLGDIYRAARVLTGWRVSPFLDGNGVNQWRSVFSSADKDTATLPMFEGEAHAFTASSDADLVFGIFANHPSAPKFLAKEILRWYVTANPPEALIRSFAAVLKANNFDIHPSLRTLFLSEAFFHPGYKNTVNKNSFQVGVELARTLEMSRRSVSTPATLAQEVGVNVTAREGTPDQEFASAYTKGSIAAMGYTTTLPVDGVFFFPDANWIRPTTLMETANLATALITSGTELGRLVDSNNRGWLPQRVLPEGRKSVDEVIQHVSNRMGVQLSADDLAQLRFYMENKYTPGRVFGGVLSEYEPFTYDNRFNGIASLANGMVTATNHQSDKARWLYVMLAMNPQFLTK